MAGVSRLQYANEIRLIRVMCSGRVDLEFILRAFLNGQDGVLIGGCRLGECNYVTQGNYDAYGNTFLMKKIMVCIGLNPERLRIEFLSAADGILLVDCINDFTEKIKTVGPIGQSEGIDAQTLKFKLEAAQRIIPYIRLVERERLRISLKSKESYQQFFSGGEFDRLFSQLIGDKLALSQIMMLLQQKPFSTAEISGILNLSPSEVSRHMTSSSRHGLVRYDARQKSYALA